MSDDRRFDPRFDPAFQPGYTGPIATPGTSRKPVIADPPQPFVGPPFAGQPLAGQPLAGQPFAGPKTRPVIAEDPFDPHGAELDDEARPRRVNPFLIVLAAVAVVLVGGGLYLVSRLRDLFESTQSISNGYDYITVQVLTFTAPLLIVLGLATAVALLVIFALRWDRR